MQTLSKILTINAQKQNFGLVSLSKGSTAKLLLIKVVLGADSYDFTVNYLGFFLHSQLRPKYNYKRQKVFAVLDISKQHNIYYFKL